MLSLLEITGLQIISGQLELGKTQQICLGTRDSSQKNLDFALVLKYTQAMIKVAAIVISICFLSIVCGVVYCYMNMIYRPNNNSDNQKKDD